MCKRKLLFSYAFKLMIFKDSFDIYFKPKQFTDKSVRTIPKNV